MSYLYLFLTFFAIGAFTFGGGYAMLPLMRQMTVENGWISESDFLNFVAISESTPGPFAINMATFIGSEQGGFLGAVLATLGVVMPSIIVILLIVAVFKKVLEYKPVKGALAGIKPVVVGMIAVTGVLFALKNFLPNVMSFSTAGFSLKALLMTLGLGALTVVWKIIFKKNFSPIILILISAAIGMLVF